MKLIKTMFVWLLLLALPLQGQAAAALNFCATGAATPPAARSHCHSVMSSTGHTSTHQASASSTLKAADGHCQDATTGIHKCSNCASCAFGAPCVPVSSAPLSDKPAGAERIAYLPHHVTSRLPDGLERPPHLLAA